MSSTMATALQVCVFVVSADIFPARGRKRIGGIFVKIWQMLVKSVMTISPRGDEKFAYLIKLSLEALTVSITKVSRVEFDC
ncbi:hypothetical protein [Scytonema sp. NUACC21]